MVEEIMDYGTVSVGKFARYVPLLATVSVADRCCAQCIPAGGPSALEEAAAGHPLSQRAAGKAAERSLMSVSCT